MCWKTKKPLNKIVANEDVVTFKFVAGNGNGNFFSPVTKYPIKRNTVLFDEIFNTQIDCTEKVYGFHSFSTQLKVATIKNAIDKRRYFSVLKPGRDINDFYAWALKTDESSCIPILFSVNAELMGFKYIYLIKCIIPKGSTYFENENKEIVSEQIIITDEYITLRKKDSSKINEFIEQL